MIEASAVEWNQVAAFIGPLVGIVGLIGAAIGFWIRRADKNMKTRFDNYDAVHKLQMETLTNIQNTQTRQLEQLNKQGNETAIAVARIEGGLRASGKVQD